MSETISQSNAAILQKLSGPIRYRITNAYMFVAVLQKNHETLCHLLASLLHIPRQEVTSVEILNPIMLCDLAPGEDYNALKPMIHIGILDFNYPKDNQEFYQQYMLMNLKTYRIYSDKLRLNVLCLNQLENAAPEDRNSGLYEWAKVFQATA